MRSILLFIAATVVTQGELSSGTPNMQAFIGRQNGKDTQEATLLKRQEINTSLTRHDLLFQSDNFHREKHTQRFLKGVDKSVRAKRLVLRDNPNINATWSNGVFYTFNTSSRTVQKLFKMGAKIWSESTCIDFVEDRNARDKVVVVKGDDCFSDIGRTGGDQELSLDRTATVGSVVHEIGHILGLLHTMARPDRDSYVTIVTQNIYQEDMMEFMKVNDSFADVHGLPYDYGSVMHYDELSSSINNQTTIIAKDPFHQKTMGSELISFIDILMINEHYGCNAKCNKSTSAKCENDGFPHPRNCSICICPSGYGGALCNQRPSGCGEDLTATSTRQLIMQKIGNGTDFKDEFEFCNYIITAPEGKKIEVDVRSVSYGYDASGCRRGGIEVKAQKDQKLTGYRFCSMKGSGAPIVSNSSRVPVILYTRHGAMGAIFSYRYID